MALLNLRRLALFQEVHQSTVAKTKDAGGHGSEKRGGSDHWHADSRQDDARKEARTAGSYSTEANKASAKANLSGAMEDHTAASEAHTQAANAHHADVVQQIKEHPADEKFYRDFHAPYIAFHDQQMKAHGDLAGSMSDGVAKTTTVSTVGYPKKSFNPNMRMLNSFRANIGKAGKGWYHGNQHVAGSTSAKAATYAAKMKEAKEHIAAGRMSQAKIAQQDAQAAWGKMATGERQHAMTTVSDDASDDIGKARSRGFEFGHGRRIR